MSNNRRSLQMLGEEWLSFTGLKLPVACVGPAGPGFWETLSLEAHQGSSVTF